MSAIAMGQRAIISSRVASRMAESESWMICVLGNFPHTWFLARTCLQ